MVLAVPRPSRVHLFAVLPFALSCSRPGVRLLGWWPGELGARGRLFDALPWDLQGCPLRVSSYELAPYIVLRGSNKDLQIANYSAYHPLLHILALRWNMTFSLHRYPAWFL